MNRKGQLGGFQVEIQDARAPEPKGPEESATAAIRQMAGTDPNGRSPEDLDAIDRRVYAQSTRRARLFKLAIQKDADDWAELQHKHATTGSIRILRIKELVDKTDYSQFVEWVEFMRPEEQVRATAVEEREKFLSQLKPKLVAPVEQKPKAKRTPRAKKAPSITLVEPDDPPPTHQPLEDPK